MSEEQKQEAAAIEEGLQRAFRRLDMTFESPTDYLNFWFPDQNLTPGDLPPDLADYYLYDLEEVEGGYRPKASRAAAEEDSSSVSSEAPTLEDLRKRKLPGRPGARLAGVLPGQRAVDLRRDQGSNGWGARPPLRHPRRWGDPLHDAVARTRAAVGR